MIASSDRTTSRHDVIFFLVRLRLYLSRFIISRLPQLPRVSSRVVTKKRNWLYLLNKFLLLQKPHERTRAAAGPHDETEPFFGEPKEVNRARQTAI